MRSTIKLFSLCLLVLTLVGCGLKGPLYHPTDNAYQSSISLMLLK